MVHPRAAASRCTDQAGKLATSMLPSSLHLLRDSPSSSFSSHLSGLNCLFFHCDGLFHGNRQSQHACEELLLH